MSTSLGELTACGRATRHPADPERPMVGEELAVARAVGSLADQLELAAREGIAVGTRRSAAPPAVAGPLERAKQLATGGRRP